MLRIGQKFFTGIGTFEIKEHLGQGKTAEVYLGINTRTVEAVAIKIAREGIGERVKQNFLREEEVLTRLQAESPDSGHFPRVLCSGEKGEQPYLVMTLVKAKSLWDMALENSSRLSGSLELERLAIDAAASYAHMLMILHHAGFAATDRKLDDVLWLADEQKVIVLDWNAVGSGEIGQRNDLYQFGVFWHQLLLGTVPPRGGQSLSGHSHWSDLTYGTQQILVQALHPQPDIRFKKAQSLLWAVQEQQKRLHLPLEQLVSPALTRLEQLPSLPKDQREQVQGEAYALLDIAVKFYSGQSADTGYEAWLKLGTEITGTGQSHINQGSESFRKGEFDLAREAFLKALKTVADDAHKQLHIHRWLVLLEAMAEQSGFVLDTAALLVQAMNEGNWPKAKEVFDYLDAHIKSEGILNLKRDFQMIQNVHLALGDIEQRDYQAASDKYQTAYKNRQALPANYRTKLMKAGWQNLDLYANACKQLAETEGKAHRLLENAQGALAKNDLRSARDLLESGYALILSVPAREGRERLVEVSLPPQLDEPFIRAFRSLSFHQQALSASSWVKQLPILRSLRTEFPEETWAENELQQMHHSLLTELAHHSDWRTADEWVLITKEEPFVADLQVQEALVTFLQQVRQKMVAEMTRHEQAVQELLQVWPTDNLLIAAAQRLDMMRTSLQRVQELTPLVFPPDPDESQSLSINQLKLELQQKQVTWDNRKAKAKLWGVTFDAQGDDLPQDEKTQIALLVARNQLAIQLEVERVNQQNLALAQKLTDKAKSALKDNNFDLARNLYTQLRDDHSFSEAIRSQATMEWQELERNAAAYHEASIKLTLFREQFETTSPTPALPEAEIGRLQELKSGVSHLTHPAIEKQKESLIDLIKERINTIGKTKAAQFMAQAYQDDEQVTENTSASLQTLRQAISAAEKARWWDPERELEIKTLITHLQKRIDTIEKNQQKWVEQQKAEAEKQKQVEREETAKRQLKKADELLDTTTTQPEEPDAVIKQLDDIRLSIKWVRADHPQMEKQTDLLDGRAQELIAQIRQFKIERELQKARDKVASLRQTDATRLQEVTIEMEAIWHTTLVEWPERQDEVEKLKQSLLQIGQQIAQYERQKQIDALHQQIAHICWPEAGETDALLQTMQTAMPLAHRCQQLLEFPVLAQTEPMTAEVKDLLVQVQGNIKTAWEQDVEWFRVQVNQPVKVGAEFPITPPPGSTDSHETATTIPSLSAPVSALEKKLNTLRRVADLVATDATLDLSLEQLKQVIQELRDDLWLRQFERFDDLALQAIAQEKYEQATWYMNKARGLQELLSRDVQTPARQGPDERLLEVARRAAKEGKEGKFALVLQISTFLRGYYQHLEQRGLSIPQLAEATQLETDALTHIIGDKRRQEIARQYRQKATTLWHGLYTPLAGEANLLTHSDDYHRALDYWGWAVVFDPEILHTENEQEKKIAQAWQERHDNRLRARFLCQRSQTKPQPSLRDQFTWLKEAHLLAPELAEVQKEYLIVTSVVNEISSDLQQLSQKVEDHLNDSQYPAAEEQCCLIEEHLAQLPLEAEMKDDSAVVKALVVIQEAQARLEKVKTVVLIDQLRQKNDVTGLLKALRANHFPLPQPLKKALETMVIHYSAPRKYRPGEASQELKRLYLKSYLNQLANSTG